MSVRAQVQEGADDAFGTLKAYVEDFFHQNHQIESTGDGDITAPLAPPMATAIDGHIHTPLVPSPTAPSTYIGDVQDEPGDIGILPPDTSIGLHPVVLAPPKLPPRDVDLDNKLTLLGQRLGLALGSFSPNDGADRPGDRPCTAPQLSPQSSSQPVMKKMRTSSTPTEIARRFREAEVKGGLFCVGSNRRFDMKMVRCLVNILKKHTVPCTSTEGTPWPNFLRIIEAVDPSAKRDSGYLHAALVTAFRELPVKHRSFCKKCKVIHGRLCHCGNGYPQTKLNMIWGRKVSEESLSKYQIPRTVMYTASTGKKMP